MCLAIPGKIVEIIDAADYVAKVDVSGVRRNINYALLADEDVQVGDYVLIHVGFAMSKIDPQEAEETIRLLEELGQYQEEKALLEGADGLAWRAGQEEGGDHDVH
jgi:hydrogenase expression/formation protein HypC